MKQLLNLMKEERYIKEQIKKRRFELHDSFYKLHKKHFICLDIMVLMIILFNFGAVFMTNYSIIKTREINQQPIIVKEVNPIQAKINDYEEHSRAREIYPILLRMIAMWSLGLWGYIYFRSRCFTRDSLYFLTFCVLLVFVGLGYDFFNNLGSFVRILKW